MEERNLTEKESLELIANMISRSKSKLEIGDGNVFLLWGILSVIVATTVWVSVSLSHNPAFNGFWALMAIGALFNYKKAKEAKARGYSSYTDKVCSTVWMSFGIICLATFIICLFFEFYAGYGPWVLMFVIALIGCGSGCIATGALLKIRTVIFGGIFSSICGILLVGCMLTNTAVSYDGVMATFILSFILMMVTPGLEMRHIAKKEQ